MTYGGGMILSMRYGCEEEMTTTRATRMGEMAVLEAIQVPITTGMGTVMAMEAPTAKAMAIQPTATVGEAMGMEMEIATGMAMEMAMEKTSPAKTLPNKTQTIFHHRIPIFQ